jgi:multidrug efflux pump
VAHTTSIAGQSILLTSNSSNFGSMFVILKAFSERTDPKLHADGIMMDLRAKFAENVRDAEVNVFSAPPVPGIGVASGFKLMVEDRGGGDLNQLQTRADALIAKIRPVHGFVMVSTQFRSNTPQLYMDIDRTKVKSLGISINDINQALQIYLGSYYVNNFNAFGRYWQVNLQAEGRFRDEVAAINQIQLRNKKGDMAPLNTLVRMSDVGGPVMVTRYNLYASAPINGVIIPPLSTGQGIAKVEEIVAETLPRTMATEWTDLTYMQIKAGNTAMYVFGLAVVLVFLALAALYESWSLPLAVILVVPMCLLCSLAGVFLRHLPMDIFVQIGFVVLVGLACKNAILIVEFARQLRSEGKPRFEATTDACRLRLRPILMTSFAFILGVLPMVIAEGAGAEMRWSLGTAVFSGMLGVTLFGIFLTPVFFYVIESLAETSLFHLPGVQWAGSAFLGTSAGALLGFLGWRMAFPEEIQFLHSPYFRDILFVEQLKHLRWTLGGGLALGLITAVFVQGGHHRVFVKARNR